MVGLGAVEYLKFPCILTTKGLSNTEQQSGLFHSSSVLFFGGGGGGYRALPWLVLLFSLVGPSILMYNRLRLLVN